MSEFNAALALVAPGEDPLHRRSGILGHLSQFVLPAIDVAARNRKSTHLLMKQNFWIHAAAARRLADGYFSEERRRWIVPMVEGSNTRSPENDLMARVGLWCAGLVGRWGVRVIDDNLRVDDLFEYQGSDPHHSLRHFVAYAAAGATQFDFKPRYLILDRRGLDGHRIAAGIRYNDYGLLAFDLFLHLLGKGLLEIPTPDTTVGLSPVQWRFVEPSPVFVRASMARKLSAPPPTSAASARGLFTGFEIPRKPTASGYANRYLLNVTHYGHDFFPENPYGLPVIVPDRLHVPGSSESPGAWRTDGEKVWLPEGRRTALEAREQVLGAFRKEAERLPVRATGCFWMATRRSDGTLRLTLVDPSYVEPQDRRATIVSPVSIRSLRDVLSGESLTHLQREAHLVVPAGGFRIVDVRIDESAYQRLVESAASARDTGGAGLGRGPGGQDSAQTTSLSDQVRNQADGSTSSFRSE
jgi:hypothetical protein